MAAHRWVVVALVVAACGDDDPGGLAADAAVDDAAIDSQVFDGPPMFLPCAYTEQADATNTTTANAELTALTYASPTVLCGTINTGHYDASLDLVDFDVFKITVAADAFVLLHITGMGSDSIDLVTLRIANSVNRGGYGAIEGDHGTAAAHLPAGDYFVAVTGFNPTAATAAINYRVTMVADAPATRCPKVTAAATYPEANDGGANTSNDMLEFDAAASPTKSLTPGADTPEPSAIAIAPATQYRISGTAANVANADDYMDRDTFEFTTGATTNQVSMRLNWAATNTDLDYFIVPMGGIESFAGGLDASGTEDEFETFAVKPSTTYWLWVGASDGAAGLPASYDVSICGETFSP